MRSALIAILALLFMGCAMDTPFMDVAMGDARVIKLCDADTTEEDLCDTETEGGQISEVFGVMVIKEAWHAATRIVAMFYGGDADDAIESIKPPPPDPENDLRD
jgi:hypothetical protein